MAQQNQSTFVERVPIRRGNPSKCLDLIRGLPVGSQASVVGVKNLIGDHVNRMIRE